MAPLRVAAVSLDAYGTLFKGGSDDLIAMLRERHAASGNDAPFEALLARREALIGELQRRDFLTMRERDDWILGVLFREFGLGDDHSAFLETLYRTYFAVTPYPDAVPCVRALRGMGLRLALVSNADVDMMDHVLRANGLLGEFDAVVTSESVRAYKPAPRVFDEVASALALQPERVLHVGDSFVADVVGAKRVGMRAAWLDRPGGLPAPGRREAEPDLTVESLEALPSRLAPQP